MGIRILYLQEFRRIGGAERALLGLVDAIRHVGVEPLVAMPRREAAVARLASREIRAVPLSVPRWRHGVSLPMLPLFPFRLRSRVAPAEIDLVHVNNYRSAPIGSFVSRWFGVPCVCHIRELITSDKIREYLLHLPDALIAVSDAVAQALVEGGLPQDRIVVVRSGIALHEAPPEAETMGLRESLGISPHDPVLGIVAHVLPHKGYDDLIYALPLLQEKLPHVKCLIVGGTPRKRYLQKLLQLAERLSVKDRLILVGEKENVVPFLHAMDVFVLPSWTEGLPITVLEGMAAGKPVVATAVGGIPEVVRDGETGLLVPSGEPGRFAEALIRLLETPILAKAMEEAGRAWAEKAFSLEQEVKQTCALYRHVLAVSPSGSV